MDHNIVLIKVINTQEMLTEYLDQDLVQTVAVRKAVELTAVCSQVVAA